MEKKNLYTTHLLILLVLINLSPSLNVPAIFIFGDSVFDAGNNHFIKNCSVQADFPPYGSTFFHHPTGRFTDGRTVADFISQFIGIGLQQPYLEAQIAVMNGSSKEYPSNGLNFASAGSGVLQGTNKDWEVHPCSESESTRMGAFQPNLLVSSHPCNLCYPIVSIVGRMPSQGKFLVQEMFPKLITIFKGWSGSPSSTRFRPTKQLPSQLKLYLPMHPSHIVVYPYLQPAFHGNLLNYPHCTSKITFQEGTITIQFSPILLGMLPIQEQLRQFKTLIEEKAINRSVVERSLFFLESGSNDIFNYFLPLDTPKLDPDAYVEAMIKEVTNLTDQIYKVGARRIVVFSLGPVGCVPARALLPAAPIKRCYGKMNAMVKKYNKRLESLVNDIPTRHPGAIGVYGAVYDTVQHLRAAPTRYGFSNVSSACCGDGPLGGQVQCGKEGYKICQNPQGFLFWDYFHPTQHTYELISEALWEGKKSRIRPINLKTLTNLTLALV
ncbi:hypothetical protein GOBAR_DD04582 [Gossypium barbadense]|nr:hypothetical protein GOBAR_DD04582 [Gossypium barbadense]